MAIIRKLLRTTAYGTLGAAAGWTLWTRNSKFVAVSTEDPIFESAAYKRTNPNRNAGLHDLCVRKVPLSKIRPELLEAQEKGEPKLVEAFCAGVWSGIGYSYQRSYLERKYKNDTTTAHQLWSPAQLAASTYDLGTQITDHFEVVEKTHEKIVVRCGDSPLKTGLRDSDGLFEMGVKVNKEDNVAEFRLRSVFYKGLGTEAAPMPDHIAFLHRLYTKLWMESAIRNVVR